MEACIYQRKKDSTWNWRVLDEREKGVSVSNYGLSLLPTEKISKE